MTVKPCRHSRWRRDKLVAYENRDLQGNLPANPRERYHVLECLRCVKCDAAGSGWTRFHGQTERAALKRAGVPEHELPAPPNHKPKAGPVAVALTCWPFPISTHFPRAET